MGVLGKVKAAVVAGIESKLNEAKHEKPNQPQLKEHNAPNPTTMVMFAVMGIEYENRNELLHAYVSKKTKKSKSGTWEWVEDNVIVLQDENNKFDPNAIAVNHTKMGKIGYVPRNRTKEVRTYLRSGESFYMNVRFFAQKDKNYTASVKIIANGNGK